MSTPDALAAMAEEIRELRRRLDELYNAEGPLTDYDTYTPTLTDVTNIGAKTAYACQYNRVGNTVTVSGRVDIDPTSTGTTRLGVGLPIASNFANGYECGGVGFCTSLAGTGFAVEADATNDRAQITFIAVNTSNKAYHFVFMYQVI